MSTPEKRAADFISLSRIDNQIWMELVFPGIRQRLEMNLQEITDLAAISADMKRQLEEYQAAKNQEVKGTVQSLSDSTEPGTEAQPGFENLHIACLSIPPGSFVLFTAKASGQCLQNLRLHLQAYKESKPELATVTFVVMFAEGVGIYSLAPTPLLQVPTDGHLLALDLSKGSLP